MITMKIKELISSLLKRRRTVALNPTCSFHGNFLIEHSRFGEHNTFFENVFISNSSVDDFTFIQKNTNVINAEIGKFCSIAAGVRIGLGSHPLTYASTHPSFYSKSQPLVRTFANKDTYNCFKRTLIGHDVWIGEKALIKDGVRIETGAVIGAGAVVTKDVPAYAIVAGVPAKIIKYRFDETTRKRILDTEWWNKPLDWLEKNRDIFSSPDKFLKIIYSDI